MILRGLHVGAMCRILWFWFEFLRSRADEARRVPVLIFYLYVTRDPSRGRTSPNKLSLRVENRRNRIIPAPVPRTTGLDA